MSGNKAIWILTLLIFLSTMMSCKKDEAIDKNFSGSGTWNKIASLPSLGRTYAISFSLLDKGFVGGGRAGQNYGTAPKPEDLYDFWMYDAASNSWTEKDTIPFTYFQCVTSSVNNMGYVLTYRAVT